MAEQILSCSPNALLNAPRNASKLLRIAAFLSKNGANQDNAYPVSKVPTNPIQVASVGYCCG